MCGPREPLRQAPQTTRKPGGFSGESLPTACGSPLAGNPASTWGPGGYLQLRRASPPGPSSSPRPGLTPLGAPTSPAHGSEAGVRPSPAGHGPEALGASQGTEADAVPHRGCREAPGAGKPSVQRGLKDGHPEGLSREAQSERGGRSRRSRVHTQEGPGLGATGNHEGDRRCRKRPHLCPPLPPPCLQRALEPTGPQGGATEPRATALLPFSEGCVAPVEGLDV